MFPLEASGARSGGRNVIDTATAGPGRCDGSIASCSGAHECFGLKHLGREPSGDFFVIQDLASGPSGRGIVPDVTTKPRSHG
jgi:hypothetical protein